MKKIKHALLMVKKNIRGYILLSVTTFISFTIMFVYLMYTDSNIYNKYRYIEGTDEKIILSINSYSTESVKNYNMVEEQLKYYKNSYYYYISSLNAKNSFGGME